MQMNGGTSGAGLQSEINVTPLVDVVLVLLIIFMVVVPLMMEGYDVDTPRVSSEPTPETVEPSQVILRIGATTCNMVEPPAGEGLPSDCRVSLAEQEIPAAELPKRLAEVLGGRPKDQRVLFVSADDRLNYEGVLRIVDLAKTGVDDLKIGVITA